jgi:hypothetical protein
LEKEGPFRPWSFSLGLKNEWMSYKYLCRKFRHWQYTSYSKYWEAYKYLMLSGRGGSKPANNSILYEAWERWFTGTSSGKKLSAATGIIKLESSLALLPFKKH